MHTDPLITRLFDLANDHTRTRQARVDDIVPLLLEVEAKKFKPDAKSWERTDHYWEYFKPQSVIDRKQEFAFFGAFILEIFHQYEEIESFSWRQAQDYNDNWHYFDLHELSINGHSIKYLAGFDEYDSHQTYCLIDKVYEDFYPPDELVHRIWEELDYQKPEEEVQDLATHLFQAVLEPPFAVLLIFLQSLHRAYHVNYFIDLFGWVSSVFIDRNGIRVEGVQTDPPYPM